MGFDKDIDETDKVEKLDKNMEVVEEVSEDKNDEMLETEFDDELEEGLEEIADDFEDEEEDENKSWDIEEIKKMEDEEVKNIYIDHLKSLGWSKESIRVAVYEAFYIWKQSGKNVFWKTVLSDDFDAVSRRELKYTLDIRFSKGVNSHFGDYLFHLKHFRQFMLKKCNVEDKLSSKNAEFIKDEFEEKAKELDIPTPCHEQALIYIAKWKGPNEYNYREMALDNLFTKMSTDNKNIEDVLVKMAALNELHNIGIKVSFLFAKYITKLDVDSRLKVGDITLVRDIQKDYKGSKTKKYLAFASKYCSYHKPKEYPIYDEYMESILKYFRNKDNFSDFEDDDLLDYIKYKGILIDFKKYYKLGKFDLRKLSHYMWLLGKEYFG